MESVEQPLDDLRPVELPKPKRGQIVSAVAEGGRVLLTVRVQESDGAPVEYAGSLAVDVLARLPPEEQRRALVEAVRLERDRARSVAGIDLSQLSGDVELW